MRIAVISDVHGNRLALEAVLDDIQKQGADSTLNLGDIVSGPMEPNWTADILMDADIPTIRGNHERMLKDYRPDRLDRVDRFAQEQMDAHHRLWINDLPETMSLLDDIFMCHGTPTSDTEPWLDSWYDGRTNTLPDEGRVTALAGSYGHPVMLCGHTHIPRAVRLRDGRLIVNPGSVGLQMFHGSPDARYAILDRDEGKWTVSLRVIPYDHEAAARQAEANGFPQWTDALLTGWAGPEGLF